MDELLYWLIEYGKVLLGYGFLMFIWPMTVFRKYLAGKSVTFRFSFCVTMQVVLVNTVVLFLGLLHILNDWTVRILFYGTFLFSLREYFKLTPERKKRIKYLFNGTYGWKNFIWFKWRRTMRSLEELYKKIWIFYKRHWLEYSLLMIAVVYGMLYFSWGLFQDRSYGFSDMYVHHSWIYQLSEGKPFSAGIYPEGMHCVVYALNALFGIRIYSVMLFLSGANIAIVLVAAYCLMKELFNWRYSAIFVLFITLTFGQLGRNIILCLARLQCSLPQEFAFPAAFICCLYLLRYLKGGRNAVIRGRRTKGYWDENLLVFVLSLSSTIVIHFYATFMAFFLCVGVAVFLWRRIFTKARFLPLVIAAILGVVIAVVPMVAGFATGIPLQGSLYWAMEVMQDSTGESTAEDDVMEDDTLQEVPDDSDSVQPDISETETETSVKVENLPIADGNEEKKEPSIIKGIFEKIEGLVIKVSEKVSDVCRITYQKTYLLLYEEIFAKIIIFIMAGVVGSGIIGAVIISIICKIGRKKKNETAFAGYFIIIIASLVYILAFTSTYIGLPMLVDRSRICFICHLLIVMIAVIPLDWLFSICKKVLSIKLLNVLSAIIAGAIIAFIYISGFYHGYLYFELTRYDATVQVANKIIDELPKESFTIVSPTEELYQIIEHGWHEELITFLEKQDEEFYTLPTEYVFIFLEKRPFKYVQYHFFDGPDWLARDKYQEMYGIYSTCPEYIASEVSEEDAAKELRYFKKLSDSYSNFESRTIIESKMYEWCKKFEELYPNEFSIYYEDEYFVCYYFRQNVQRLYNLVME